MFKLPVKFGPNVKILAYPVLTLSLLVILFSLFAKKGITLVNNKITEFNTVEKEERALEVKLSSLQNFPLETLSSVELISVALPSKNPAVWLTSQVKRTSRETEVAITKIEVTNLNASEDITGSDFSLEFETSDYSSMLNFLKDIIVYLPISYVEEVKAERMGGRDFITTEVDFTFYWSDFPKTLPPLTEPLQELTGEDDALLSEISNFKMPVFIELDPDSPQDRPNPFN